MGKEHSAEEKHPAKIPDMPGNEAMTVGAGCFWCIDSVYRQIKGVNKVLTGYSGGYVDSPTYDDVCSGITNHAEVVRIWFDPK